MTNHDVSEAEHLDRLDLATAECADGSFVYINPQDEWNITLGVGRRKKAMEAAQRERKNFSLRRAIVEGTFLSVSEIRKLQKKLYEEAASAKVGTKVNCPSCGTGFIKNHPQKAFCSNQRSGVRPYNKGVMPLNCKDWYWNRFDERKRRYAIDVLGKKEA